MKKFKKSDKSDGQIVGKNKDKSYENQRKIILTIVENSKEKHWKRKGKAWKSIEKENQRKS